MSFLSLSFAYRTRLGLKVVQYQKDELTALYLAKATISRVISQLEIDNNEYDSFNEPWKAHLHFMEENPSFKELFPKAEVNYEVTDEESKINLNTATLDTLMGLEGIDESIASAIIDWRDEDSAPFPNGAEDDYYQGLPFPYHCKNAPFALVQELLAVKGITPLIFYGEDKNHNGILDPGEDENMDGKLQKGIEPFLTVYGNGKININTAPLEVLSAIPGMSKESVKVIIDYRKGGDGVEGTKDDGIFKTLEDLKNISQLTEHEYLQLEACGCVKSTYFMIRADVTIGRLHKKVIAIVDRSVKPVRFILWKES